jgi:hypothetical protein
MGTGNSTAKSMDSSDSHEIQRRVAEVEIESGLKKSRLEAGATEEDYRAG